MRKATFLLVCFSFGYLHALGLHSCCLFVYSFRNGFRNGVHGCRLFHYVCNKGIYEFDIIRADALTGTLPASRPAALDATAGRCQHFDTSP